MVKPFSWMFFVLLAPAVHLAWAGGSDSASGKKVGIVRCEAISAHEYRTGLLFNPSGYQTFFHRSECFQELAVEERDLTLCDLVRERDSWFFEGWFISPVNCRKLVKARQDSDDREFAALDPGKIHRLTGLEIRRNGNGRDFDLLVATDGEFPGDYQLEVYLEKSGGKPALLYRERVQSGLLKGIRILLLNDATLTGALGGRPRQATYALRAELRLMPTESNRFYYHRLPTGRLLSARSISVNFAEIPPWQPEQLPID